jgi:hypothetical protein
MRVGELSRRIEMTLSTIARKRIVETERPRDIAGWLGLVASPTFGLMAWISGNHVEGMMGASTHSGVSVGGMAWMYCLMSLFHLSPWLRLASDFLRPQISPTPQTRGD